MEIPSPFAGIITEINISLGDKIKQGDSILSLKSEANSTDIDEKIITEVIDTELKILPVLVPDIGDFEEVEIIEILVSAGDELSVDDSIITLESDKASMEIPTPVAGKVIDISVALGNKVKLGDLILNIEGTGVDTPKASQNATVVIESKAASTTAPKTTPTSQALDQSISKIPQGSSHASPSIRKLARELGVDLSNVSGIGQKGRVLDTDLKGYVKQIITSGSIGNTLPKIPSG